MDVESVDHVYVETRDYEKARAFWTALGFAVESEWGDGGHRAGMFVSGEARMVVATADTGGSPSPPTVHFRVPNTAAAQARAAASPAVRVVVADEATHWGTRWVRLADPDGNVWVLEQTRP